MKTSFEDESEGLYQPNLLSNWHLWREILFNACPNAQCEPFRDGCGQMHWLEVDRVGTEVTLIVYRRGGTIARAIVEWIGPDEAVLECLLVAAPHRKRGLATYLVNRVITLAAQQGTKHLTGRVIRKDAERNPALLDWYRRRGFAVEPVLVVPFAEPARSISKVAQQSQRGYETVATLSLNSGVI